MLATGLFRRVDDMGKIAIPKELREKMCINAGDVIDFYVEENNIVMKKNCPSNNEILHKALYFSIINWFDENIFEYKTIDNPEWINHVCEALDISEELYREIMALS